jgi:hypothetical protein
MMGLHQVYITYSKLLKILPFALCTSPLLVQAFQADHTCFIYRMIQRQRIHLSCLKLDRRQVWAPNVFSVWHRLVLCCEYVHSRDSV